MPAPSVRGSGETPGSWPGDQERLQKPTAGLRSLVAPPIRAVAADVVDAEPLRREDLKALNGFCLGCLDPVGRIGPGSVEDGSEKKGGPGADVADVVGSHVRQWEVVVLVGYEACIVLPQRAGRGMRRRPFVRGRTGERGRPCM